jgi:diguanylate cyclase (GGDEF)-like protein
MNPQDLLNALSYSGKDPSRLIFEDELTGIYNRRFLFQYLQTKVQWETLNKYPLSLIMIDLDEFKQINDNYGHQIGDQALIWVAGLLKEISGENGMAIRYAGDEFMILFLQMDKQASLEKGAQLLNRIHSERFQPKPLDDLLRITFSIGIASAPEDAKDGKTLIRQADTALYSAKKRGRNCLVNARQVHPEEVFDRRATHHIEDVKIVGRSHQVSRVAESLKKFSQKQSQFLIMEGPAGIGKTEFLEAVRQNLAKKKIRLLKANGSSQEMFRPYYLITNILIDILNQREDKGSEILKDLRPNELAYLAQVMPQIGGDELILKDEKEDKLREGIFNTLADLIPKTLDNHAFILFIDDLHLGDEASMLLLRRLILKGDIPLFICGTSLELNGANQDRKTHPLFDPTTLKQDYPLERFYKSYQQELNIRKLPLTPLSEEDITKHMKRIFPNVEIPEDFKKKFIKVSKGNPLFISEILRKMVLDQKISLVGRKWVIQPVNEGYFPKSLDEIINQKIEALDKDGRDVLEQMSALGEDVSLSMLIGSSDAMEAKVLDFIDQAVAQGLLQTEFQLNDETVRFIGKRILEVTYDAIDKDRKAKLHDRIGNYHEKLYQNQLLPSASTVAYHFKRSPDRKKAKIYEQIRTASNSRSFNIQEAIHYTEEKEDDDPKEDLPLTPESLAFVPRLIRDFMVAVRNIGLYPPGSKTIVAGNGQLKNSVDRILEKNERLNILQQGQVVVVNSRKIDVTDFRPIAESFLRFLDKFQLKGIGFHKGLTDQEIEALINMFGQTDHKSIDEDYWKRHMDENGLEHIDLKQIRYAIRGKSKDSSLDQMFKGAVTEADHEERKIQYLREILRSLVGITKNIRLYPVKSAVIKRVLEKLIKYMRHYIRIEGILTLSRTEDALLVNGKKVSAVELQKIADDYRNCLSAIGLSSLTFLKSFTDSELEAFISVLGDLQTGVVESKFWERFSNEKGLSGILFNRHLYDIQVAETMPPGASNSAVITVTQPLKESESDDSGAERSFESFLDDFPELIKELFRNKGDSHVKQAIQRLFTDFQTHQISTRKKRVQITKDLLESLEPAFQQDFIKALAEPFLDAFSEEKNPDMIMEMASFLGNLVTSLIRFVEYPTAARILSCLNERMQQLEKSRNAYAKGIEKSLERNLEPSIQKLLVEDLKSGDPVRQRNAAQLLNSLKQVAIPFLIETIKQEDDPRVRQIAALLLKKQGDGAVNRLKKMLVLEITPEERLRILDIIHTLTTDLKSELIYALNDGNPRVQEAAFQLAERLNDNQTINVLLGMVKNGQGNLATSSIKHLAKINPPRLVEALSSLLNTSKDEELSIACCQALGQIANPASIEPLSNILAPKGLFWLRKKRSPQVRAAAAFALGQISHPKVTEVLTPLINDGDPRVQEVAKSIVQPNQSLQQ